MNPLFLSLSNPDGAKALRSMRENLSETITEFVDKNGSTALEDFDKHKFDDLELHDKAKSRSLKSEFDIAPSLLNKWLDDRNIFTFNSNSSDTTDTEEED